MVPDNDAVASPSSGSLGDNHPMDERGLACWLDALVEQGLIEEWHWTLHVAPRQAGEITYLIDAHCYTHDDAVRLVRDFEGAPYYERDEARART